jgi:hypothetical protein
MVAPPQDIVHGVRKLSGFPPVVTFGRKHFNVSCTSVRDNNDVPDTVTAP